MNLYPAINDTDNKQGKPDAPLTLVEYGDYECPHCGAAHPIIKRLQKHFGNKLLFVFRNFPLAQIHPNALHAAYTAEAAGKQKKFWPVHDLIFENQERLATRDLLQYAELAGADIKLLMAYMSAPFIVDKVEDDIESGARSGVNGTPTFFINGKRHDGNYSFDVLKDAMERLL